MSVPIVVPATLTATLATDVLRALEDALAPPPALRAKAKIEVEIEAAGEGTFTITAEGAQPLSAKKGFAKDPLICIHIAKGGWPLVQRELQAFADGLPAAPELRRHVDALRAPAPGELDVLVGAIKKIADASVRFDVKGGGIYAVARGPVEEATRVLKIAVDAKDLDKVLKGAALTTLTATLDGDRGVLTTLASALAPMLKRLR